MILPVVAVVVQLIGILAILVRTGLGTEIMN